MTRRIKSRDEIRSESRERNHERRVHKIQAIEAKVKGWKDLKEVQELQEIIEEFHLVVSVKYPYGQIPGRPVDIADPTLQIAHTLLEKFGYADQIPAFGDPRVECLYFAQASHRNIHRFLTTVCSLLRFDSATLLPKVSGLVQKWSLQSSRLMARRPDPCLVPLDVWILLIQHLVKQNVENIRDDLCCYLHMSAAIALDASQHDEGEALRRFVCEVLGISNFTEIVGEELMWSELRLFWGSPMVPAAIGRAKMGNDLTVWQDICRNIDFIYTRLHYDRNPLLSQEWEKVRWCIRPEEAERHRQMRRKENPQEGIEGPKDADADIADADNLLELSSLQRHSLEQIDRCMKDMVPKSLEGLLGFIGRQDWTSLQKVRAVWAWVSQHIEYDHEAFSSILGGYLSNAWERFTGTVTPAVFGQQLLSAPVCANAFENRKAVCLGFAKLTEGLCRALGISCQTVEGWAKTGANMHRLGHMMHAWNIVELDGRQFLLDTCWSIAQDNNGKRRKHETWYFCPSPSKLIYTHLPIQHRHQLLKKPVTERQFLGLPILRAGFWALGLSMPNPRRVILANPSTEVVLRFKSSKPTSCVAEVVTIKEKPCCLLEKAFAALFGLGCCVISSFKIPCFGSYPELEVRMRPTSEELPEHSHREVHLHSDEGEMIGAFFLPRPGPRSPGPRTQAEALALALPEETLRDPPAATSTPSSAARSPSPVILEPDNSLLARAAAGSREVECQFFRTAKEILQSLNIEPDFFNNTYDKCFCPRCAGGRGETAETAFSRGQPPRPYACPYGWACFGLHINESRARAKRIFAEWPVSFHGTTAVAAKGIVNTGELLMPGDRISSGFRLGVREGHIPKQDFTFTSPSLKYAGKDMYASVQFYCGISYRLAFQLRQQPDTFGIQPQTIAATGPIDPLFSNAEIEWKTNRRGTTQIYKILLKHSSGSSSSSGTM